MLAKQQASSELSHINLSDLGVQKTIALNLMAFIYHLKADATLVVRCCDVNSSPVFLSEVCRGDCVITESQVFALASLLEVSVEVLYIPTRSYKERTDMVVAYLVKAGRLTSDGEPTQDMTGMLSNRFPAVYQSLLEEKKVIIERRKSDEESEERTEELPIDPRDYFDESLF